MNLTVKQVYFLRISTQNDGAAYKDSHRRHHVFLLSNGKFYTNKGFMMHEIDSKVLKKLVRKPCKNLAVVVGEELCHLYDLYDKKVWNPKLTPVRKYL